MHRLWEKMKGIIKTHIIPDPLYIARVKFKQEDGPKNLRTAYPLNNTSIVFDLGGYKGEWAETIRELYAPEIYIFEPVEEFSEMMKEKFKEDPKMHVFAFGLSDANKTEMISMQDNASSAFVGEKNTAIEMRDVAVVIKELGINRIDLIKLNIEGGEFHVLPRMIEEGLIPLCTDIQVQFHHFYPDAERLREGIRKELQKTHHLTYDYPFTFENWRKND